MRWRLQPYAMEAATLCDGGCNPMCWQVEAAKAKEAARLLHAEAQRLTQQATYPEPEPEPETEPEPRPRP